MPTITKTILGNDDPRVVVNDFSNSPLFKDGTRIVSFSIAAADFSSGDTVKVVIVGARSIQFASIKKLAGTEMPITETAITTVPAGIELSTGAITGSAKLWVFIACNMEA